MMHSALALALAAGFLILPSPSHAAKPITIYSFQGAPDGSNPFAGLTYYDGFLYGTTGHGGTGSNGYGGTVFKVNIATDAESILHSFNGPDGILPLGPPVAFRGSLYGAVVEGGAMGFGCLYQLNPATNAFQVVYNFGSRRNDSDGSGPGALTPFGGHLYGVAGGGSKYGRGPGVIFRFDPATGKQEVVYRFAGAPDGAGPSGFNLIGNVFYGTTGAGGANNTGTIFEFDPATNTETVLYSFMPVSSTDAKAPSGGLTAAGSLLFGASIYGGVRDNGAVFGFDTASGTETVLHSFTEMRNGINPNGPLLIWNNTLYGSLNAGGLGDAGGLFSTDMTSGTTRTYYRFTGGADGGEPYGGLIERGGFLYGTTGVGGTANQGTVFKIRR